MLASALRLSLDGESCPHVAVLLRTEDELVPVLASFYALGVRRNGWLVHRSVAGEEDADRERLAAAGLDVRGLEAAGRLDIVGFDPQEPPERSTERWEQGLEAALGRGLSALWYSRFAVGPDDAQYEHVLAYERQWEACFHGREVVTLCPYVVGELDAATTLERFGALASIHAGVLVPGGDDGYLLVGRT